MATNRYADISDLIGLMIFSVDSESDIVTIKTKEGITCKILHHQDCCESVGIHSQGDLKSLVGQKIFEAKEEIIERPIPPSEYTESETWTKHTINGIEIIWHGESNGYYGEIPSCEIDDTEKLVDLSDDMKDETQFLPSVSISKV